MSLRWLFLVVILQVAAHAPAHAAKLPLRHYTTEDGLPHNRVNAIVRDSHGFLWFCTTNGLSQFDGTTFVNYGADQAFARSLTEDPRGFYWIVSGGAGIYRLDPRTDDPNGVITRYTAPGDADAAGINSIVRDRSGTLWAGGAGGLFTLEERGAGGVLRAVGWPSSREQSSLGRVWDMLEDRSGALWIGTDGGLWRRTPDGRFARRQIRPGNPPTLVRRLLQDPEGRIWVGHESGLTIFAPEPLDGPVDARGVIQGTRFIRRATGSYRGRVVLPSAPGETHLFTQSDGLGRGLVSSMMRAADGRTWIATMNGGLTVFDGTVLHTYTAAEGVSPRATALAEDQEGNLWIGSQTEGVSRLARSGFTSYGPADGLKDILRTSIVGSDTGNVVIVSGRQLFAFDGRRFSRVRLNLPVEATPPVLRDRVGDWWIGTRKGLYRFAAVRKVQELASARPTAVYTSAEGLPAVGVDSLCEDGSGDIWVAASPGLALARWGRATGRVETFSSPSGAVVGGSVQSCATDRAGGVWLGLSGRLVRFERGELREFTEADGVPRVGVTDLIVDRNGRLWVAYLLSEGLLRCDDPTVDHPRFTRYTTREGLTSIVIQAIAEDSFGRIYLGTKDGVDRLEPDTGRVRNYTSADGLGNDEVDDIFLDARGVLWFSALQSVATMRPRPDPTDLPPPPVRITSLRAGGIERPVPSLGRELAAGIELPQARSQLEVAFATISFGVQGQLRFQYRLEGVDRDWSTPVSVRAVNYARFPAGHYRFQVRAVSAEGAVSPQPAVVSFAILPPFWMRWWFDSLAGLALATGALAIHRARTARLLAVERVRTRLAMDLHDDVGASLSQIAVLSEVARQEAQHAGAELMRPLSRIADVSREMVDNMSDIVWSTNPSRDRLSDLVTRMRRFATDVMTSRGVDLSFTGPEWDQSLRLEPDLRRQIYLIFKEAVNNAARHSHCRRVEIALEVRRRLIALRVRDDGVGFEPCASSVGHGMTTMSRRAEALHGSLKIVSKAGEGTTLNLLLPLTRARPGSKIPPA